MIGAVLLALLFAGQPPLFGDWIEWAQPPARETAARATAVIRGHVTRADGRPLGRARVRLLHDNSPGPPRIEATTDADGAYELAKLLPGRYRVSASKVGHATLEFNQRRPFERGELIWLDAGETRDHVDIALPRHGAVEGRIVDENGDPVDAASVSVLRIGFADGRRRLVAVPGVVPRRTNELGRYRVYGLQPGEYVVSADVGKVGTDDMPGYAATYFPGTPIPSEARLVSVGLGEEIGNVDFPLVPIRTVSVSGRTLTSDGEPFQAGIQMRPSRRSGAVAGDQVGARTWPDGRFEFPNVSPGEYVICAFKNTEMAWHFVTVNDTDVSGVTIHTMAGSTITGRITFEGLETPNRREVEVTPVPADLDLTPFVGGPHSADIRDDWTFEITDVSGPRRLRLTHAPEGWGLKQILLNGVDATDAILPLGARGQSVKNIEIVLTRLVTHITGYVTDARGNRAAGYTVIAFASDADKWGEDSRFFAVARPARDGTFAITGLPPGEYFVAIEDRARSDDEWHDPDLLNALARRARRVVLTEGETVTLNLRK